MTRRNLQKFKAFVPTFSAAANLTGRIADPHGSHVDGVIDFMQAIGNGKCVGHLGKNDARGARRLPFRTIQRAA
jgi:hypothetical protein